LFLEVLKSMRRELIFSRGTLLAFYSDRGNYPCRCLIATCSNLKKPLEESTIGDVKLAVSDTRDSEKYNRNTKLDILGFLKRFFLWMVESGY